MTAVPFSDDSRNVGASVEDTSGSSWVDLTMIITGAVLVLGAIVAAVLI